MEVKALSYEDIENIKSSFSDKDYDELNKLFDKFRHHLVYFQILKLLLLGLILNSRIFKESPRSDS
jgi:hypothetical protein